MNGHTMTINQQTNWISQAALEGRFRMPKSHGLNGGAMEVNINGVTLTIHAPIPTRPKVIRIVTDDGRQTVLGDYGGFNNNEISSLQTIVAPPNTSWKLHLTDKEKKELSDAEADLNNARRYVGETGRVFDQAKAALDKHLSAPSYEPIGGGRLSSGDPDAQIARKAEALERKIDEAEAVYREARTLEQHALNARNKTRLHLSRVAQRRMPDQPVFKDGKVDEHTWKKKLSEVSKEKR
jgi:hypothetical protein